MEYCGLSVCNDYEPCKNGWTDWDAVWDVDSSEPRSLSGRSTLEGGDDVRIFSHAAEHHSQRPWRQDFPTCCSPSPFAQTDIIGAVIIVWRVRGNGKIIRSVLYSIVCTSCAQCNAHIWTDLTVVCWLDLVFLWLSCVVIMCVSLSVLSVGRTSGRTSACKKCWGDGMVFCLEWGGNDLRMVQLLPLPLQHLLLN